MPLGRGGGVESVGDDRHLRSHGKIGDCGQSTKPLNSMQFNSIYFPLDVVTCMRTLIFKAQLTSAFFVTFKQTFVGSSQLLTAVERAVIKSLSTVQTTKKTEIIETLLKFGRSRKSSGNTHLSLVFPQHFYFSPTSPCVSF